MHVLVLIVVVMCTLCCSGSTSSSEQQELRHDEFSEEAAELVRGVRLADERLQAVPTVLADIGRVLDTHWPDLRYVVLSSFMAKHKSCARTAQDLHHDEFSEEAAELVRGVRLADERLQAVPTVLADIGRVLDTHWPGCQIIHFGSSVTGLALQQSDVDVFVRLNDTSVDTSTGTIVEEAKTILEKHPELFTDFRTTINTLVPIVTFQHIPTGFYVDVNLKSELSARYAALVRYLLRIDERKLDLAIIVKYWAKLHKNTMPKGFASGAITLLIIFYLQQLEMLPAVSSLQENAAPYIVEKWNTGFEESDYKPHTSRSLYELLGGFFVYYDSFDFNEYIVSPFLGRPVRRQLFDNWQTVPQEFEFYRRNVGLNLTRAFSCVHVCIQDPFVHNKNLATTDPGPAFSAQLKRAALKYRESNKNEFLTEIL